MKYNLLLMGKNNSIMEDFFTYLMDDFECISTSNRYEDIVNHFKYYAPDALVYCLNKETVEDIKQLLFVKAKLQTANVPLVVIGSEEDCDMFVRYSANNVQLVLIKPITINAISERLKKLLNEQRELEEKRRAEKESRIEQQHKLDEEELFGKEHRQAKDKKQEKERKHILVVDDDPLMLKMIKEHLHDDYDVATAISGKVALKFLENKRTDLILLDYQMPDENGPEVLEKLRNNKATSSIPVVFLTGITEKKKIQKALVLKPQGYLLKPIDHEKLLRTIKKLIG